MESRSREARLKKHHSEARKHAEQQHKQSFSPSLKTKLKFFSVAFQRMSSTI